MNRYFYLSSPYTKYPFGPGQAFIDVCKIAAKLMDLGIPIFCPIAHTHPISSFTRHDPLDSEFWQTTNQTLMAGARAGLIVVQMEGWENSSGVAAEIEYFSKIGRPIFYLFPSDFAIEHFMNWLKTRSRR
jgi:Domain of unknown function (DUF1937)